MKSNKERKKQRGVTAVKQSYPRLLRKINDDLKREPDSKAYQCAVCVALMLKTGERLGNETSAKAGHLGISTLTCDSVSFSYKDTVNLTYTGKSGVKQQKHVVGKKLYKHLWKLIGSHQEKRVFTKIDRKDVNDYLKPYGFTSKSIRTYLINESVTKDCGSIQETAEFIGHKPATLKAHYLLESTKRVCQK